MKTSVKLLSVVVLGAALCGGPVAGLAQSNDAPAKASEPKAEKKAGAAPKHQTLPFKGQLKGVDKTAKSITVGERTFQVTSVTRIFKDGKPALLESGAVGEPVTGSYKPAADGKLNAVSIYFGGRSEAKGPEKKKGDAQ